ncbi:hypothetical protein CDT87_13835 [Cronobacter sakazakii]|nr:hypothetical protein CDT87_13835 [Cronobacter sakazakii]PQX91608.1 hypothetical protein C5940_16305 [Cronobacter sakazakii]
MLKYHCIIADSVYLLQKRLIFRIRSIFSTVGFFAQPDPLLKCREIHTLATDMYIINLYCVMITISKLTRHVNQITSHTL